MNSKFLLQKIEEYQNHAILLVLFIKLTAFGFTLTDCLGALVLLSYISAGKVIDYLFPKRPDLYAVMEDLRKQLDQVVQQNEELGSDVNAIKLSKGFTR